MLKNKNQTINGNNIAIQYTNSADPLNAFELAKKGDSGEAFSSLEEHFDRHKDVAEELLDKPRQTAFLAELELSKEELSGLLLRVERRSLPLQMLKDAIVSYGEQLSSRLLAEVCKANELNARQVDSRRVIVTDDEYGSAKPIWDETEKFVQLELNSLQEAGEIPIMGGFIAANRSGETTTLGRGGSDYSAALVGAALQAKEIQIWTDVTGVLTCDPRICSDARTIEVLSYNEAAELAGEREDATLEVGDVEVIYAYGDERLRLVFPGKPSADVIATLKGAAFRWSPRNGAWQRKLTTNALMAASRLLGTTLPKLGV